MDESINASKNSGASKSVQHYDKGIQLEKEKTNMNRTELANIITNESLVDYTKDELREITDATNKIVRGTEQGKNAQWLVCDNLYRLQKVTKGKDFVKLAESLGYQKSTAYKYSKVGEYAIECGIGNELPFHKS